MFLIRCTKDESLCIVKDLHVVCDKNVVKNGDVVTFYWKKKSYEGEVLNHSDDCDFLEEELKKTQQRNKKCKKTHSSLANAGSTSTGKRLLKKPRTFSPSNYEGGAKKKVKQDMTLQSPSTSQKGKKKKAIQLFKSSAASKKFLKRDSSDGSATDDDVTTASKENQNCNSSPFKTSALTDASPQSENTSPTKEELKAIIKNYQRIDKTAEKNTTNNRIAQKSSGSSAITKLIKPLPEVSDNDLENNVDPLKNSTDGDKDDQLSAQKDNDLRNGSINEENNDDDEDQLFGRDYVGSEMVELHDGIYCKKKIHKLAVVASHQATHVARKLLEGVFKHESLLKCTVTGRPSRTSGQGCQTEVVCMHEAARDAIIAYSQSIAKKNNWETQDEKKIKSAMAQKLVELRQVAKKNVTYQKQQIA